MSRILALAAALLLALRLFTGLVYEWDEPTTFLVLKHRPALFVERSITAGTRVRDAYTVRMQDEGRLAGQDGYALLMRWSPVLAGCCAAAAWLVRRRARPDPWP